MILRIILVKTNSENSWPFVCTLHSQIHNIDNEIKIFVVPIVRTYMS